MAGSWWSNLSNDISMQISYWFPPLKVFLFPVNQIENPEIGKGIFKLTKPKVDLRRRWHHDPLMEHFEWTLYTKNTLDAIHFLDEPCCTLYSFSFLKLSKNLAHILSNLNYYRNRQAMRPIIKRKRWSYKPPKKPFSHS